MKSADISKFDVLWIVLSFAVGFGYLACRRIMPSIARKVEGSRMTIAAYLIMSLRVLFWAICKQGIERLVLVGISLFILGVLFYRYRSEIHDDVS